MLDGGPVLGDLVVDETAGYRQIETLAMLRPALRTLTERERRILLLRFVRGFTQEEIGQEIGVSQMQVSRLLTRILSSLREELTDDEPPRERSPKAPSVPAKRARRRRAEMEPRYHEGGAQGLPD